MAYEKLMNATRSGACAVCRGIIVRGDSIVYDVFNKTARHVKCPEKQEKESKNG